MPSKNKGLKYFKLKQGRFDGYNDLVLRIIRSGLDFQKRDAILKEAAHEHQALRQEEAALASNVDVFEKVMELGPGDEQDGGHIEDGSITLVAYTDELVKRLKDVGFLPGQYKFE